MSQRSAAVTAMDLDDLRDELIANDAAYDDDFEMDRHDANNNNNNDNSDSKQQQRSGQNAPPKPPPSFSSPQTDRQAEQEQQQEGTARKSKDLPAVPVDVYFFEACRKTGIDPTTAFRKSSSQPPVVVAPPSKPKASNVVQRPAQLPAAGSNKSKAASSPAPVHHQSSSSSPRGAHPPSRPVSRASSATSSADGGESILAATTKHRIVCDQERRLRDVLVVLNARKAIMQEVSKTVTRKLRFKQRIQTKARALRNNQVLAAAWEHELRTREAVKNKAAASASSSASLSPHHHHHHHQEQHEGESNNNNNNNNTADGDQAPLYSIPRELAELGGDGQDVLFEHALRQRQVWDLRTMRQQRARDRRHAEYEVRLRRADARAAAGWQQHDTVGDQARLMCQANHARVKERRRRDEEHIANVEARFALIDERRSQQYREHLAEINTARSRRDEHMRSVVDERREHAQHMGEVVQQRTRAELERTAVIQNRIEQLDQQRTKHEFLRFVRDVELANRSLVERDHTLVVVHRSEALLQRRRGQILGGFAKSEAAAARVEQENLARAREHAEKREQKHFEARTLRLANEEDAAVRRLEKARREEEARKRKARDEAKLSALAGTRFEQQRLEQEDRVERLSRQMMARRDQVQREATSRHQNVENRRKVLRGIQTVQSSPLIQL